MTSLAHPRRRSRTLGRAGLASGLLLALAAALLLMPACGETVHSAVPLDCSAEGSYDIIETYSVGVAPYSWYGFQDTTPGGMGTGMDSGTDGGLSWARATRAIEGGRCGSQAALVLVASGFHDYGDAFVDQNPGDLRKQLAYNTENQEVSLPYDASGYQGVAFWARSPGATTKGVTLLLTDGQSNDYGNTLTTCILSDEDSGANGSTTVATGSTTNPGGSTSTTTGVALPPLPPGTCGNYFSTTLLTTDGWQLYEIPFSAFYQAATPNRAPDGFDPSTFFSLLFRIPKEAQLELWIDELGFYPKKGVDGGQE